MRRNGIAKESRFYGFLPLILVYKKFIYRLFYICLLAAKIVESTILSISLGACIKFQDHFRLHHATRCIVHKYLVTITMCNSCLNYLDMKCTVIITKYRSRKNIVACETLHMHRQHCLRQDDDHLKPSSGVQ